MAQKPYIGIKRLWYGDAFTEAVTKTSLQTWLSSATEVKNYHGDTFTYEESDPEVTDYENGLTGEIYYRDLTKGSIATIKFSIGEFDEDLRVDLAGGELIKEGGSTVIGWGSTGVGSLIEKGIVAQTKTGGYVVLTRASIVAKTDMQEKNFTLGVTATEMANKTDGVKSRYWIKASTTE